MPFTPTIVKRVTLPLLKQTPETTIFVQINGPIFLAANTDAPDNPDDAAKAEVRTPPHLANCIDLERFTADETGGDRYTAECQIVVGAVLRSTLDREYAGDAYVGRCFAITQGAKKRGSGANEYRPYFVDEIERPEGLGMPSASERATGGKGKK